MTITKFSQCDGFRYFAALLAISYALPACATDPHDEASDIFAAPEETTLAQNEQAESATIEQATEEAARDEPALEVQVVQPTKPKTESAETASVAPKIERAQVEPERWAKLKAEIRGKFPTVKQLSVPELKVWIEKQASGPTLLDVRETEEFDVSHLQSAQRTLNIADALRALKTSPKDAPVVLYCSVGYRSSALAEQLQKEGYSQVFNLEGSIFEWANQGEQVVANDAKVGFVHPYNSDWGQLLRREMWSPIDGDQ
ncbi:MAG: rhodanese-related sulfurtransferase [Planctomycetota bacterium]|jgi:rhodanese-related sulfurtransferase